VTLVVDDSDFIKFQWFIHEHNVSCRECRAHQGEPRNRPDRAR
jgi:hypothetical protein